MLFHPFSSQRGEAREMVCYGAALSSPRWLEKVTSARLLFYTGFDLQKYCGLSNDGLAHGRLWQLVTFQFLHWGPLPWHLLFNCLGLYFFGREVEQAIGPSSFLRLYFFSGVAGGLLQSL